MKKGFLLFMLVGLLSIMSFPCSHAQIKWTVGGNLGFSIADGAAGLHLGPMAEVVFGKGVCLGSEFNINTQGGTPIEWANYYKYFFSISGSKIRPYADGGFSLFFFTGGPYFGIRFGGGAAIPIAPKLFIAPEMQLGPVFGGGRTVFFVVIRGGIRYEI